MGPSQVKTPFDFAGPFAPSMVHRSLTLLFVGSAHKTVHLWPIRDQVLEGDPEIVVAGLEERLIWAALKSL